MNFRFRTLTVLGLALLAGGCASAGSSASSGTSGTALFAAPGDDLPEWVQALPEGTPPQDTELTNQTALYLLQGRWEESLNLARTGIEQDSSNPQPWMQAGEAYLGLGNLAAAAEHFDRAESIYPRYIIETVGLREQAWIDEYNAGVERLDEGDLEGAAERFVQAGVIYSFRPEAYLNLGAVYAQLGRYEESAEAFGKVVEVVDGPWGERVDEETAEAWKSVAQPARTNRAQLLLRLERYDEAAVVYAGLVASDPENLDYLTAYASALVASGRSEEAQGLFDQLLARDGLSASDYFNIGVGLYQVDQFVGAAEAFRRSRAVVPMHRDAVFNLAQTLYLANEWAELETVTRDLTEIDALNALGFRFRANALLQLGREQEAMTAYNTGENLPITMDELGLRPGGRDIVLAGVLSNHDSPAGTSIRLRFTFFDVNGAEIGTGETTVRFDNTGEAREFEVPVPEGAVFGYRYQVLS